MGGIGTCKQIANKYGNGAAHYNTNAINVAKAVHKETNCPLCARDTGENQYWPVLFYGRDLADSADGVFLINERDFDGGNQSIRGKRCVPGDERSK